MTEMNLSWADLRPWNGTQQGGFEELCCQLAECESVPNGAKFFRKAAPDAGLECYWRLPGGQEWGWQAKFFRETVGPSQWGQLDGSVKRALEKHPLLKKYFVCLPRDREDPRIEKQKWFMDRWNEHETKWRAWASARGTNVDFIYWGEYEIFQRLMPDEHRGRIFFWFHKELLTDQWFKKHLAEVIEDAGPRYTPKTHVQLPIAWALEVLGRTPTFFDALRKDYFAALKKGRILSRQSAEMLALSGQSFATLEARFEELFAQLADVPEEEIKPVDWQSLAGTLSQCLQQVEECMTTVRNRETEPRPQERNETATRSPGEDLRNLTWRREELQDLRRALWRLDEFVSETDTRLCNLPALLVVGDAGVGKTHLFCDVAERRISQGLPTIPFLGQHLKNEEPWSQLIRLAHLTCTRDEFLGALSAAAQARRRRALILIDALNEGDGKALWPTTLPGFLSTLRQYPWIGIALSARNSYERIVVQEGLIPEKLHRVHHHGFAEHEYEAAQHFFGYYSISLARVPLLVPEYQNPLFLKVLCEGLRKRHLSAIPQGVRGVSAVFEFFIGAVQEKLEQEDRIAIGARLITKASDAVADRMANNGTVWLPVDEADRLLSGLTPQPHGESLLHLLISEGLLSKDMHWPDSNNDQVEVVRFPYERFTDHLLVRRLLDRHLPRRAVGYRRSRPYRDNSAASRLAKIADRVLEPLALLVLRRAFRPGQPLAKFISDERTCWSNQSLVDALSVQLPERTKRELVDVAPFCATFISAQQALVRSLLWREPDAFTMSAERFIRERVFCFDDVSGQLLDVLLTLSATPDHPYNARFLHKLLFARPLADRDSWWSTWLHYQLGEHGAVDRLLDWSRPNSQRSDADDDTAELMSVALGWFLSCPDRKVRDNATKALVALLAKRLKVLKRVLETFAGVDDPYTTERLYAVAYGCSMRQSDGLTELAQHIYETEFQHGTPVVNILARDYARGVLERALSLNLPVDCDSARIRPPYRSGWPAHVPSKESLERYRQPGANPRDVRWSQVNLYDSVLGGGDFARYIIGTNSNRPDWLARRLGEPEPLSITTIYEQFRSSLDAREAEQFRVYKAAAERRKSLDDDLRFAKILEEAKEWAPSANEGVAPDVEALTRELQASDSEASEAQKSMIMLLNRPQKDIFIKLIMPFVEGANPLIEEHRFDLSIAQRWIFARVLELGWTVERFGAFDRAMGSGRGQHNPSAERVGKKYQWIAYHEFLARLADNFEFADRWGSEKRTYEGPWQLSLRNIDPSSLARTTYADGSENSTTAWWSPNRYEFPEDLNGDEWIRATNDLPPIESLLLVQSEDSRKWLSLQSHIGWQEPDEPDEDYSNRAPKRQMYYLIFSYVVRKRDKGEFVEWARQRQFFGRWMPEGVDIHQVFQGEWFWAPAAASSPVGWTRDARSPDGGPLPVEVRPTTASYYGSFEYDSSTDDRISMYVPADWLCKQMNLAWTPDGHFLSNGSLTAFDPSTREKGPSALLVDLEAFRKFLDESKLEVLWTLVGEKLIVESGGGSAERLLLSGVYELLPTGQIAGTTKTSSENRA